MRHGPLVPALVFVAALGAWGAPGHPLGTDAGRYPWWDSTGPLSMPLGTVFEWKLVASDGRGRIRWERGVR